MKNNLTIHVAEYKEPSEDYIIVKTSREVIRKRGSLYNAACQRWKAKLNNARKYKYVLAVVNGIVCEIYHVDEWYQVPGTDRIAFNGSPAKKGEEIFDLIGKRIPEKYRKKGMASPFLYKRS